MALAGIIWRPSSLTCLVHELDHPLRCSVCEVLPSWWLSVAKLLTWLHRALKAWVWGVGGNEQAKQEEAIPPCWPGLRSYVAVSPASLFIGAKTYPGSGGRRNRPHILTETRKIWKTLWNFETLLWLFLENTIASSLYLQTPKPDWRYDSVLVALSEQWANWGGQWF